jgi:hypothetical protein
MKMFDVSTKAEVAEFLRTSVSEIENAIIGRPRLYRLLTLLKPKESLKKYRFEPNEQ